MMMGEDKVSKQLNFIMYHYVRDLAKSEYPTIKGLDKALFVEQIEYLLKNYEPVCMEENG